MDVSCRAPRGGRGLIFVRTSGHSGDCWTTTGAAAAAASSCGAIPGGMPAASEGGRAWAERCPCRDMGGSDMARSDRVEATPPPEDGRPSAIAARCAGVRVGIICRSRNSSRSALDIAARCARRALRAFCFALRAAFS